jgi:hypothetical protein
VGGCLVNINNTSIVVDVVLGQVTEAGFRNVVVIVLYITESVSHDMNI